MIKYNDTRNVTISESTVGANTLVSMLILNNLVILDIQGAIWHLLSRYFYKNPVTCATLPIWWFVKKYIWIILNCNIHSLFIYLFLMKSDISNTSNIMTTALVIFPVSNCHNLALLYMAYFCCIRHDHKHELRYFWEIWIVQLHLFTMQNSLFGQQEINYLEILHI